jgi:hypothetical protein
MVPSKALKICQGPGRSRNSLVKTSFQKAGGAKANEYVCKGFLVCKVRRPDGSGRSTHPYRKVGDVAPFLVTRDWGPIGAVWTPEIKNTRPEYGRSIEPNPSTLHLHTRLRRQRNLLFLRGGNRSDPLRCPSSTMAGSSQSESLYCTFFVKARARDRNTSPDTSRKPTGSYKPQRGTPTNTGKTQGPWAGPGRSCNKGDLVKWSRYGVFLAEA